MELINNIYFNTLGLTLLHSLWQGILVGIIYLLAKQLFKNYPVDFKLRLTVFALMSQFILSTATFLFIIGNSLMPTPNEYLLLNEIPMEFSEGSITNNWAPILGVIWMIGSTFLLFKLIAGYLQIENIKKTATPIASNWTALLEELKDKLNINKNIQLLSSINSIAPFTIGYLKPAIIFPIGLINQLEIEEVEAIISHELAHIKFDDFIWNLLFSFIEAIFYFHPVVWWLSQDLSELREERCDQVAIEILGNRMQYAKTLVRMQEHANDHLQLTMAFSGNKKNFSKRIFKILQQPYPMKTSKNKIVGYLFAGIIISCLLISSVFANQNNTSTDTILAIPAQSKNEIEFNADYNGGDISPSTEEKTQSNIEIESTRVKSNPNNAFINLDTIPKKRKKETYSFDYRGDKKRTQVKMKDGEITFLKIDGKLIPKSEYENYRQEVEAIKNGAPPAPPAPPTPPAPPAIRNGNVTPTPPALPNHFQNNLEAVIEDLGNLKFDMKAIDFNMDQLNLNVDSFLALNLATFNDLDYQSVDPGDLSRMIEEFGDLQTEEIDRIIELRDGQLHDFETRVKEEQIKIQEQVEFQLEQLDFQLERLQEQQQIQQEAIEQKREQMEEKMHEMHQLQEEAMEENLEKLKSKAKKKLKEQKRKKKAAKFKSK